MYSGLKTICQRKGEKDLDGRQRSRSFIVHSFSPGGHRTSFSSRLVYITYVLQYKKKNLSAGRILIIFKNFRNLEIALVPHIIYCFL